MNTGEGGLSPYHLEGGADIVFQIGTAKYGVRNADGGLDTAKLAEVAAHPQVRMFEIKLSQGAKPGKGGILPGIKVTEEIARIRGIPAGQDSISPNRQPEVNSASELLDFIDLVRRTTGKPVGFKAVIGAYGWLDELFEEVWRRGMESAPDFITVDSGEGGSGAAPMPLIDNVGLPVRYAWALISSFRPAVLCLRSAVSRHCSAIGTPVQPVSRRTTSACSEAWFPQIKPNACAVINSR
jgi:glutamate synthase domain-containing protein 2